MSDSDFVPYPSTPSFAKFLQDCVVTESISGGTFLGTPKLHGSNITLIFRPRRPVQVQSRDRILSRTRDTHDAFRFFNPTPSLPLETLVERLLTIRGRGHQYREIMIAGELAGGKIQKGVALTELPVFFAIFNISIDGLWVEDMRRYRSISLPDRRIFNVYNVGPIWEIEISDFRKVQEVDAAQGNMDNWTQDVWNECPFATAVSKALLGGSHVVRGRGEGIVWTLIQPRPSEKLINFKTKAREFMTTQGGARTSETLSSNPQEFVIFACPIGGRRMYQGLDYIVEVHGATRDKWQMKYVGVFVSWVVEDTLKEEGWRVKNFGTTKAQVKGLINKQAALWYRQLCTCDG